MDADVCVALLPPPPRGPHHAPSAAGFRNPWPSFRSPALKDLWDALTKGATLMPPPAQGEEEQWDVNGRLVQVRQPLWDVHGKGKGKGRVCWLGHAGVLIQVPFPVGQRREDAREMVGVLFDPIFSKRCSPTQRIGPSRYLDAPCPVSSLPAVHIVCISHDHYDHLDYGTVMDLFMMNPGIHFFVPLGVKQWFLASHIPGTQVTEMDWHQRARVAVFPSTSRRRRRRRRSARRRGKHPNETRGRYRDLSSEDGSAVEEEIPGEGRGSGYPPRSFAGVGKRLRNQDHSYRRHESHTAAWRRGTTTPVRGMMPGAYEASDGDGETDTASRGTSVGGRGDDLESGGASVSPSDFESASESSEFEVTPSARTSVSGRGGTDSDIEVGEQGTVPLLSNTVPPPRSRRPPSEHTTRGSRSRVVDRRGTPVCLEIICTPAQHRSGRGLLDQMSTLWASWVVRVVGEGDEGHGDRDGMGDYDGGEEAVGGAPVPSETAVGSVGVTGPSEEVWAKKGWNVFFGGDTGYRYAGAEEGEREMYICPAFKEIAHRYGPMDLCLLPISTGSSLSFLRNLLGLSLHHYSLTSAQHSNAWDAIQIAKLMNARRTLAIHHSTFSPEDESRGCVYEFVNTAKEEGVPQGWEEDGCFIVADIGQVLEIP